jgi:hypothetical protein
MNKQKILTLLVIFVSNSNTLYPMLKQWKYKPITETMTPEKATQRDNLCYVLTENDSDIDFREITPRELNWTCHQYSLKQILGYGIMPTTIDGKFVTFDKFFDQIEKRRDGCLALYTQSEEDRTLLHSGIVTKNKISSKWGNQPYILTHPTFRAPDTYGETVGFFELKPQYDNPAGKELVSCELYHDATNINLHKTYNRTSHFDSERPKTFSDYLSKKLSTPDNKVYVVEKLSSESIALRLPEQTTVKQIKEKQTKDLQFYRDIRN